jgi:adenylate cyclase
VGPIFSDGILFGCILLFDKESRDHLNKFDAKDLRLFDSILKKIELAYNNILLVDSIKNSKKLIDSIMSSITTGIIKIDLLGEIEYINDSALEIFNFQQENVLNNHYAMVFENNDQLLELLEFAETKEHIFYEENILIHKENKETTQVNLTISPVFDEGSNSGVVISFEDLSDINKVKTTFKKYVSESIVDELLLNDSSLELGGKEQEVCVLFCDIRGFTAMSEKLEPSKVVFLLNHYFEIMIRVLFKNKGTLDKIIGDELMVLFGVPEKDEQDVDNAIRTAKEMFVVLDQFNVEMQKKDLPEIRVGIGINYGKVISGNIGSSQQMNYTVIGDNVNLAARLCSAAKSNEVIISESVFEKLEEKQGFIKNQDLKVKGKSNAIKNWKFTHSELEQIKT